MARFSVAVLGRDKIHHYSCFEELGRAVARSLSDLGHYVTKDYEYLTAAGPGRFIVLGAQNMREVPHGADDRQADMPADMIVYNSEQLSAVSNPKTLMWAHEQLRSRVVWDYSLANVETLKKLGIERAVHCPVGYHPSMTCIPPVADEDIDVLFYGSRDKWRNSVLNAIEDSGLKVVRLFGVYGKERDDAIARAKVVLNLHFYRGGVFEIFRCSHLFANGKCVVTEGGGRDLELEALAREAAVYVPREVGAFVEACQKLIADADLRRQVAERGFEVFKRVSMVENVRKALERS